MIEPILWLIFVLSSVLLVIVVLLQEPKGGGLAEAFGGMGAQTFGVKASGITKFTSYVAIIFVLSAILITCDRMSDTVVKEKTETTETEGGPDGQGAGTTPPAKGSDPQDK